MTRSIIGILFALLSLSGTAQAEVYVSVAPFEVSAENKNGPTSEMMQELVTSCLSATSAVAVVERADLTALTEEKSHSLSGLHSGGHAPLQLKGIQYVITGSLTAVEDQWLLSLQANDPATTRMIAAHSATLTPRFYGNNGALCDQAVNPFIKILLHRAEKPFTNVVPEDDDHLTSSLLLQGIGLENSGDHAHAFPCFLKILDRDPHNADATCWLAISYAGAGMQDFAQKEATACFAAAPHHPKREQLESLLVETPK